ncbi:MAG: FIG01210376: hypothetical protein, partial [uncultured Sphingosinicella sp.]
GGGHPFQQLLHGGVRMFLASAHGWGAARSDRGHRARPACARGLSDVRRARPPQHPRRASLAPDRASTRPLRLVELATDAGIPPRGRRAGDVGPLSLWLARPSRPGQRPIRGSLCRLRRRSGAAPPVGDGKGGDRLSAERNLLSHLGGAGRRLPG